MSTATVSTATVNIEDLRSKVQNVYQQVARNPHGEFHFEMGRALAEKLGYPVAMLDCIPAPAIESFAGVGYHFDLAELRAGEIVLDLGSGSGMDVFYAALEVGPGGKVIGLDMTNEQLEKAEALRTRHGFENVSLIKGYIEQIPRESVSFDVVISNGVINLSAEKNGVFREIARVLKPGGRMAISDIVTEKQLTDAIVADSALWAACIGGAAQQDSYQNLIEAAGLHVTAMKVNSDYQFLSDSAQGASTHFGVKSISLIATKGEPALG